MPVVIVHLIERYDAGANERLGHAVTDAVRLVVPAPSEAATVIHEDIAADAYMRGGRAVVWCDGTPAGEWPDGSAFEDVRFVDRSEIEGDAIARPEVGNDLARTRSAMTAARAAG